MQRIQVTVRFTGTTDVFIEVPNGESPSADDLDRIVACLTDNNPDVPEVLVASWKLAHDPGCAPTHPCDACFKAHESSFTLALGGSVR